ncbi:YlbE-like family protein [Siminovitchia sediminis]|uniref:YlbE-like family protein n=1 Tax=Siminovitchia sediminis TaxID=1274353 RepID=A0ABW4KD57_9BACI
MRTELIQYIYSKHDLKRFIREQPQWYRTLSRNPELLERFEIASSHYFEKTIPHRVQKFSQGVQMASMMMGMLQAIKS